MESLKWKKRCRIYDFRHTCLTRLAAVTDAFSLMKIAGHASIKQTEQYITTNDDRRRDAFSRLHDAN
jgi:integrase